MNKRQILLASLMMALVLVAMTLPVRAAEGIQVSLTANQSEMTVGDPVELTLEVKHPAGYQVIIPQLEGNWGPFEVQGQSQATTVANDDGTDSCIDRDLLQPVDGLDVDLVEDRADPARPDRRLQIIGNSAPCPVHLRHLADLLADAHFAEQIGNAGVNGFRIVRSRVSRPRKDKAGRGDTDELQQPGHART